MSLQPVSQAILAPGPHSAAPGARSGSLADVRERGSRANWPSLAYQPGAGRDLRFDFLRGFAVFAMVVDHLVGPSRFYLFTGGNRFYTSAAEGFVFISGFVVGMVYVRIIATQGLGPSLRQMLGRGWQLYALAVGLTLAALPVSELLNLPWAQGIDLNDPLGLVWSIATLHRTYYLVDVPLLYALLLLVSPLALVLLNERRTWVLLAASWAVWAGYQLFPDRTDVPWPIAGNYLFQFAAWQVLFFTAMALGFHRETLESHLSPRPRRILLLVSGSAFAALIVLYVQVDSAIRWVQLAAQSLPGGYHPSAADIEDVLFAKGDLRPGRIVASAVVFLFLYLLTTEFWVPLRRALGWFLLPLGQNALYSYSAHVVAAVAIGLVVVTTGRSLPGSVGWDTLLQIGLLAALWLAIRFRVLMPDKNNRKVWMYVPAVLAIALLAGLPIVSSPQQKITLSDAVAAAAANSTTAQASAARAARRFGTPIPASGRTAAGPVPVGTPIPGLAAAVPVPSVALPAPVAVLVPPASARGDMRLSEYVGDVNGRFLQRTFYSPSLDRDIRYFLYLPPGYGTEGRRYPVVYSLHGGSGDKEEWAAYGMIDALDRLVTSKQIQPMIMVLPQGDWGYWINAVDGGPRWGDYLSADLVQHVDSTFRTLRNPGSRAIGGLSMGGYGALVAAFHHPDVFGVVQASSPSLHEDDGSVDILGTGKNFLARDPIWLAQTAPNLGSLQISIDIGEDDPWVDRTTVLHDALSARGLSHLWNLNPGGHDGVYWESQITSYLHFYDSALNVRSG